MDTEMQEINGVKQYGSIVEKTVLLRVNFRIMGISRKVSSGILKNATNVNAQLLRIQKTLLESKELEAIKKGFRSITTLLPHLDLLSYIDLRILISGFFQLLLI